LSRQPGQGGEDEQKTRDLRAELLAAEAAHFAKTNGAENGEAVEQISTPKRALEERPDDAEAEEEDPEAKRRRILEETRDIDADSVGQESDTSDEERYFLELRSGVGRSHTNNRSDDDEDEAAELMR
jgi:protein CWC15